MFCRLKFRYKFSAKGKWEKETQTFVAWTLEEAQELARKTIEIWMALKSEYKNFQVEILEFTQEETVLKVTKIEYKP